MIFILKILLLILFISSSLMIYYVFLQHKRFLMSDESAEVSIMNKFIINIIASIVYLFFILISCSSIYLIFQQIIIK